MRLSFHPSRTIWPLGPCHDLRCGLCRQQLKRVKPTVKTVKQLWRHIAAVLNALTGVCLKRPQPTFTMTRQSAITSPSEKHSRPVRQNTGTSLKKISSKGKFLYSAISSHQDRSKCFPLYFPDTPVHSDTISASLASIQPLVAINE